MADKMNVLHYFLKKKYENLSKIESLQDILYFFKTQYNHGDKDKNDLYSDTISDIFLSYFIRFIPFETWKNFINQEIIRGLQYMD